eukprot:Nk52_evm83s554 gene=Nk52_evmTU83s554
MPAQPRLATRLRLTLSPWDKFVYYNRFPFKLVLNLMVVIMISGRILLGNWQFHEYQNQQFRTLQYHFDLDCPEKGQFTCHMYDIDTVLINLRRHYELFYSLGNDSVSLYNFTDSSGVLYQPYMTVVAYKVRNSYDNHYMDMRNIETKEYLLTDDHPIGPFESRNETFIQDLFHRLIEIRVVYMFGTNQIGPILDSVDSEWTLGSHYDFSVGGGFGLFYFTLHRRLVYLSSDLFSMVVIFVIVLTFFSALLTIKTFIKSYKIYKFAQHRLNLDENKLQQLETPPLITWQSLTFRDKCSFFNFWHLLTLIGDVALFGSSIGDLSFYNGKTRDTLNDVDFSDLLLSIGAMCSWVGLIKYFEWRPKFYVLFLAIKNSLLRVGRFIITITPIYVGYTFAGVVLFHNNRSKFGDASKSARTLFALLCGDNIWAVFNELDSRPNFFYTLMGHIYVYTFCITFLTTVLNVFIFIIQDGYQMAKTIEDFDTGEEEKMIVDNARLNEILIAAHVVGCQDDNSHTCSESEISFANDSELEAVLGVQKGNFESEDEAELYGHSEFVGNEDSGEEAPLIPRGQWALPQYGAAGARYGQNGLADERERQAMAEGKRALVASSEGLERVRQGGEETRASSLEQSRERLVTELQDIKHRYMQELKKAEEEAIRLHFEEVKAISHGL